MAITEAFTGTETVGTTEHSLTTDTAGPDAEASDGVFQCFIDFNALVAGDIFEFALYEKVLSSSTQRKVWAVDIAHAQSTPNWCSPAFILMNGWDMTLIKKAGTDRSIDWSIRKVA